MAIAAMAPPRPRRLNSLATPRLGVVMYFITNQYDKMDHWGINHWGINHGYKNYKNWEIIVEIKIYHGDNWYINLAYYGIITDYNKQYGRWIGYSWMMTDHCLVGANLPLWKKWWTTRHLGWWNSQYMETIKFIFQTTNQLSIRLSDVDVLLIELCTLYIYIYILYHDIIMQYLYIPHMCVIYQKKTYTVTKSHDSGWSLHAQWNWPWVPWKAKQQKGEDKPVFEKGYII